MNRSTSPAQRILVVDDNVDVADTLAMLLECPQYEVRKAYNGREAVDVAQSFMPDLIILDIDMPVMDGFAAARMLRDAKTGQDKQMLIALTGMTSANDRLEARNSGFDMILPKPIEPNYLLNMVESVLGRIAPARS